MRDVVAGRAKALGLKLLRSFSGNGSFVNSDATTEEFWALKDINFEIQEGDRVGIIGRNGAGKSTLLKILSRITEPTTGRIRIRGRVASLLEVGTGFHPELTGRENIFLNGAILGMGNDEIKKKFDEIVSFAEVERFLDTPVKRYSSGMYVRLAFAVAASLEPEILIVDEVLAVGDVEFQKKCLGKMSDVAQTGRTVLFVSHNMAAISSLTQRCLVIGAGRLLFTGTSGDAIAKYVAMGARPDAKTRFLGRGQHTRICDVALLDSEGVATRAYTPGLPFNLRIEFETDGASGLSLEALLVNDIGQRIALASLHQFHGVSLPAKAGRYGTVVRLAPLWLASGSYRFDVMSSLVNVSWDHWIEDALEFDVEYCNPSGQSWDYKASYGLGTVGLACIGAPKFSEVPGPDAG